MHMPLLELLERPPEPAVVAQPTALREPEVPPVPVALPEPEPEPESENVLAADAAAASADTLYVPGLSRALRRKPVAPERPDTWAEDPRVEAIVRGTGRRVLKHVLVISDEHVMFTGRDPRYDIVPQVMGSHRFFSAREEVEGKYYKTVSGGDAVAELWVRKDCEETYVTRIVVRSGATAGAVVAWIQEAVLPDYLIGTPTPPKKRRRVKKGADEGAAASETAAPEVTASEVTASDTDAGAEASGAEPQAAAESPAVLSVG